MEKAAEWLSYTRQKEKEKEGEEEERHQGDYREGSQLPERGFAGAVRLAVRPAPAAG